MTKYRFYCLKVLTRGLPYEANNTPMKCCLENYSLEPVRAKQRNKEESNYFIRYCNTAILLKARQPAMLPYTQVLVALVFSPKTDEVT